MKLKVKLDPSAILPTRAHDTDAGWDLYAREDFTVPAGGSAVHDTGVHMQIPEGYAGLLVSKSGLNVKHSILSTGLVDAGYSGAYLVKLYNHDRGKDYTFRAGDKISQVTVIRLADIEGLEVVTELDESERGSGGFGSSGR